MKMQKLILALSLFSAPLACETAPGDGDAGTSADAAAQHDAAGVDAVVLDAAVADQLVADTTTADSASGDGATTDAVIADAATADAATTDAAGGDAQVLDVSMPDVSMPDVNISDVSLPDIAMPDVNIADINMPDISTPDVSTPDTASPDVTVPDSAVPDTTVPDAAVVDSSVEDSAVEDAASSGGTITCPPQVNADMQSCPSYLGNNVVSLCTCGSLDQAQMSCNPGAHVDRTYCWSAPHPGTFRFDLSQRSTSLALGLFSVDNTCQELGCSAAGQASVVDLTMTAGQQVYIVLEEIGGNDSFTLAINEL